MTNALPNATPIAREVCVVSGGSGGIGSAVCRSLAQTGAHVVVVDIDDERAAEVALALREQHGLSASHVTCDVTSSAAVQQMRDSVIAAFGRVDVLVNLAGVGGLSVLGKISDADFERTLASHLNGTLYTLRAFAPDMKARGYGRVINTSSIAALGRLASVSYSAAKGAIEALTRSAAVELAPRGITVNCVAPGVVNVGMFLKQSDEQKDSLLSRTPMRRGGEPDEVAACYRFLASREAGFVTGQTLYVCGGASMGG